MATMVDPAPSSETGWYRLCALVGSIVLVGVLLIFLQAILVPFVLAIFLAYLVRPFAEYISSRLCLCRRARKAKAALDALDDEEVASLLPAERKELDDPEGVGLNGGLNGGREGLGGRPVHNPFHTATLRVEATLPRWVGVLLAMALAISIVVAMVLLMAASVSSLGSRVDAYQHRARELWDRLVIYLRQFGLNLSDVIIPSKAISSSVAPLLNASIGLINDFVLVLIFLFFLLLE